MGSRFIRFLFFSFLLTSCGNKQEEQPAAEKKSIIDSIPINKPIARDKTIVSVDISPLDQSYWPEDYPTFKMAGQAKTKDPIARVIYSRPHLQGRHIFHEVLKYGEPWRLGANESTELDLHQAVKIQGQIISPGRYVLYCIPQKDHWTLFINSNTDSWGLEPDRTKDLYHFDIPVTTTDNAIEYFTIRFEENSKGANLLMAWDNIEARLPMDLINL